MTQSDIEKKLKKRLIKMDDSNKTLIKRIRYLQLTVDIIIEMIEVGEDSMSYILHNLHVLYDEIDNLAKKVVADGME